MWARALPSSGELWLFEDSQVWGDINWRTHISWRRMGDDGEVRISGLAMYGYDREAREAIFAELGRLGFKRASWIRMKNGVPIIITKEIKTMATYRARFEGIRVDKIDSDVASRFVEIGALEYDNLSIEQVVAIEGAINDFMQSLFALGSAASKNAKK